MRKFYFDNFLLFSLVLLTFKINLAQSGNVEITGYVYDKATGLPLESANIIVSGTKWGTSSDKTGAFKIASIPPGNYEMLVSMVGYSNESKIISTEPGDKLKLKFNLSPGTYQLRDIEITAAHPREWSENLKYFKRFFLGQTDFSEDCIIENEYILDFIWKGDTLIAKANSPLIVENRALGYRVKCYLNQFYWVKGQGRHYYDIYSWFSDLEPKDDNEKNKWERNRNLAYDGSLEHFLYSLVNGNYAQEGFEIFLDFTQPTTKSGSSTQSEKTSRESLIGKSDIFDNQFVLRFNNYLKIKHYGDISWIKLQDREILLDAWGYPTTNRLFTKMGYWGDFGIADLLPKYYMNELH